MSEFRLYLFGAFRLTRDGRPAEGIYSDKVRALLAYLTVEAGCRPVRREALADLLWEGYPRASALQSLRTALYHLRQLFVPLDLLRASRQDIQLDTAHPHFWCDALALEDQPVGQSAPVPAVAEFLAGFTLPDSPAFAAWQTARRNYYRQRAEQVVAFLTPTPAARADNLPRTLTPFFGREPEIEEIQRKLLAPDYPLVTVTGMGGVGKTRLALTVAGRVRECFPDGVWFVSLADVAAPPTHLSPLEASGYLREPLAAAIAGALGLRYADGEPVVQQLLLALRSRSLLLILDNFEHLTAGMDFIIQLATQAPRIKLLITSRGRLGLQMEQVYLLRGFPTPDDLPYQSIQPFPAEAAAVELFVERAGRQTAGFKLTAQNQADVLAICRAVEGLPLAIELAASLADHKAPAEIRRVIAQDMDNLAEAAADRPPRQRSMRAVLNHSWALLPGHAAAILAGCSLFRGGFTAAAAAAVLQATPADLKTLLDASLLSRNNTGRYDIHELLRQMAAEKLAAADTQDAVQEQYASHYLQPFRQAATVLAWYTRPEAYLDEIAQEMDNIRQAWYWAVQARRTAWLNQAIWGLGYFLTRKGLFPQGLALVQYACQELETPAAWGTSAEQDQLWARLHGWHAYFLIRAGAYAMAGIEAEQSLDAARAAHLRDEEAGALWHLGTALRHQGKYLRAYGILREGLEATSGIRLLPTR